MIEYVKKDDVLDIIDSPLPRDIAVEYLYELKGVWLDEDEEGNNASISRIDKVKNVIRNNYSYAMHGLFFTPNLAGDHMSTLREKDGVTIDICYDYEYFEVFGLTEEEQYELLAFYNSLGGK